ncbi:MAG TPA: TolC family protein [Gemmatimonadaceae bacterium]|nr:TolC family protein [Gemmatimonadaceae bacterium]
MVRQFLIAFAVPTYLVAQTAPPVPASGNSLHPIPLPEAVTLAQRNTPAAVQARGQLRTSASAVRSAYGAFIPSLTASLNQVKQSGQRFDALRNQVVTVAQPWSYSTGISSNIELFDGGRRFADLRARRADVDAAQANEVAQRYNIALSVKREYANILAARESEAAARAQLQQAQAQLQAAVARVRAGAATMSDSLRSLIQVGDAQLALITAQTNVRVASAALTRLVGTPFVVTAVAADTADVQPMTLDSAALEQMAVRGPAVQQAEMQLRAANAGERSARSGYFPSITMGYSYNGNGTDPYGFGNGQFLYGSNLNFRLNFPLFNNFTREDQIVRASVSEDNAEAGLRDARLAAQQSLVQQLGGLRSAEERIRIQQVSVAAAQEDLRVQQQRYAVGASTLLDLLTSQSQLNQARAALIQARQDYRIARAEIEAIIGRELTSP